MLYRISVTERGLTGIANIFRSRLSRLDDLLGAGTVPLTSPGWWRTLGGATMQLVKEKPITGRHWGRFLVSPKVNVKVRRA